MEISAHLKTLSKTPFFSYPARHSPSRLRLPTPTVAMAAEIRSPRPSAAAVLSTDPRRRDEVLSAALDSLSNCLSETYLDETVPGLKSKARGKVSCTATFLFGFCFLVITH